MIRHHKEHIQLQLEEAIVRSYFHLDPILTEYSYHDDSCFSPDGQTFAVVSDSNVINLFKCDGCIFTTKIPNKKYGCNLSIYHPTKNALYLNSCNELNDHAARLLDLQNPGFIRYFTLNGHTKPITTIAATSTGIITSSLDQKIKFWDDSQDKCTTTIDLSHPANIALHPNGLCLAAVTESTLYIYDTRNLDNFVGSVRINAPSPIIPHFGMRGTSLALIGRSYVQEINMADLTFRFQKSLDMTLDEIIPGFSFTPYEDFFLIPTDDYSILVADSKAGSQVTVLTGHKSPITSINFSSAYHNFVSTGNECLFWTVDMLTYNSLLG